MFYILTSVFPILATKMPRVKMVLIYILASVRKDLLVMELPVQVT